MVKARVPETDQGIQGDFEPRIYNQMQRRFRDKGWMETKAIIASGINRGLALEIGPGPGYLGLEWLKHTQGTELRGLDISPDMIAIAEANANEYGLSSRVRYVQGDGQKLPFEDATFDAAFTNGSLHEWSAPEKTFAEIHRILKPGGRYFISDLRRDISPVMRWLMYLVTRPKEIRPGLITSLNASYTQREAEKMLKRSPLKGAKVSKNVMGIVVIGERE
jgi:ubiquinone/menaquinone biosynthesis C-methylase UbiE